jgi:hypothetical protein
MYLEPCLALSCYCQGEGQLALWEHCLVPGLRILDGEQDDEKLRSAALRRTLFRGTCLFCCFLFCFLLLLLPITFVELKTDSKFSFQLSCLKSKCTTYLRVFIESHKTQKREKVLLSFSLYLLPTYRFAWEIYSYIHGNIYLYMHMYTYICTYITF